MKFYIILFLNIYINQKCKRNLWNSYNLQGLENPLSLNMTICHDIKKSCCTYEDELKIYQEIKLNNIEVNLLNILNDIKDTYKNNFKLLNRIKNASKIVYDKLKFKKKINGCTLLTKRINSLNIFKVSLKLNSEISKMVEFLKSSYKGFYCSLCDYKMHQYYDTDNLKIIISKEFCKRIIEKSINYINYVYNNLPKVYNIFTRFITNCDYNANYKYFPVSKDLIFNTPKKYNIKINYCLKNLNNLNWYDYCNYICTKFSIVKLGDFWQKNLKKVKKLNFFYKINIRRLLKTFNNLSWIYSDYFNKGFKELQESDEESEENMKIIKLNLKSKKIINPYYVLKENDDLFLNNYNIYFSKFKNVLDLDEFQIEIKNKGIDYEEIYDFTSLTLNDFSEVKMEIFKIKQQINNNNT